MENHNPHPGAPQESSEDFRTVPNPSEDFRTIPKSSEAFGTVPQLAERKASHTLTVREVARLFEAAGVARTERSIVNWCQRNRQGVSRLDCYFDPNERRYYITPQSVELAVAEEKAKAMKASSSEPVGTVPNNAEGLKEGPEGDVARSKELEKEVLDLKITNRGKDLFIEQLQKERDGFFEQLLSASCKMGELEARLLQLEGPQAGRNWEPLRGRGNLNSESP